MNEYGLESENEAIDFAILFWEWQAENPLKSEYHNPFYIEYERLTGFSLARNSFLCEWDAIQQRYREKSCSHCPYYKKYGDCDEKYAPYSLWWEGQTHEDFACARRGATAFLERLRTLRKESKRERLWKWVKHILRGGN